MIELCSEYLLVRCCVTYAFESESTHYSCLNVKELLVGSRRIMWSLSDCNLPWIQNHLKEHSTICPNWPNDWALFWVFIWTVQLTVCSYNVRNAFQSESTLYPASICCSWRRLEVVLKTSCKYVLKTSWKTKNCCAEDVLKTYLEDVWKTCLEDVLETNKMFTGNIFF